MLHHRRGGRQAPRQEAPEEGGGKGDLQAPDGREPRGCPGTPGQARRGVRGAPEARRGLRGRGEEGDRRGRRHLRGPGQGGGRAGGDQLRRDQRARGVEDADHPRHLRRVRRVPAAVLHRPVAPGLPRRLDDPGAQRPDRGGQGGLEPGARDGRPLLRAGCHPQGGPRPGAAPAVPVRGSPAQAAAGQADRRHPRPHQGQGGCPGPDRPLPRRGQGAQGARAARRRPEAHPGHQGQGRRPAPAHGQGQAPEGQEVAQLLRLLKCPQCPWQH